MGATLFNQICFNQGTLSINNGTIAQASEITITLLFSTNELRSLGSIDLSPKVE